MCVVPVVTVGGRGAVGLLALCAYGIDDVRLRDLDATIITNFRCWGKVPTKFCGVYDGDGVWCDGGTVSVSGETFDENG